MGMRKYMRSIAKARLAEMGAEHIHKRMGLQMSRAKIREAFRCLSRKNRVAFRREMQTRPHWRRVLFGDLAKQYWAEKHRKEAQERNKRAALKKHA